MHKAKHICNSHQPMLKPKLQKSMTLSTKQTDEKEYRTHNSTYPKGWVSCSVDTLVQAESSVLRMKFNGKSPALRVAAKR